MRGIGIDIVDIPRIAPWVHDREMLDRVFTETEQRYALARRHPHACLAAMFAAKEAFMKAIGTGWNAGVSWRDIELRPGGSGEALRLYNTAEALRAGRRVFASVRCSKMFALAMVVIDG